MGLFSTSKLTSALVALAKSATAFCDAATLELQRGHAERVTKNDLAQMEGRLMSAIGDWSAKVGPKLDRIQTGLDELQALVEKLQNSPGAITPEDQALLDQIENKVDAIATDADSVPATPPANP